MTGNVLVAANFLINTLFGLYLGALWLRFALARARAEGTVSSRPVLLSLPFHQRLLRRADHAEQLLHVSAQALLFGCEREIHRQFPSRLASSSTRFARWYMA